ncbi:MAG: proprotein convertase P-domain-containing protein, partial [Bacteroidetes bacterium]|nr:proprotein convertase P-domain-containing protein [Bacteroidota bacterium]
VNINKNFNPSPFRLRFEAASGRPIVDANGYSSGFYVNDAGGDIDYVTISGFEVKNATSDGIKIIGGNDSIVNNIVHHNGNYNILQYSGGNDGVIAYNKCYTTTGTGSNMANIRVAVSSSMSIHNNLCYDANGHGIYIDENGSTNCTIKNNTCYNNGGYTVSGGGGGTLTPSSGAISVGITDAGCPTTNESSIAIATAGTVSDVNVKINITHTWDGDLNIYLRHPDGTTVLLCERRGGSGDNFVNTWFDDESGTAISAGSAPFTGSYSPDNPLTAFDGKVTNGTWKLQVCDAAGADVGTLTQWELSITYVTSPTYTYTGSGVYVRSGSGHIVKNNILVAKSSAEYYPLNCEVALSASSGYNTLYKNGATNVARINPTNYTDSITWNATTSGNNDFVTDPKFISVGTDFHIKSYITASTYAGGSWPPFTEAGGAWTQYAGVYSTGIDNGNPADPYALEQDWNGERINQGCYGNTPQATRSCHVTTANAGTDINPACPNPSITLNGNAAIFGTGVWTVTAGAGSFTDAAAGNTPVSGLNFGANTYRWTISNMGCSSFDEVVVTNQLPTTAAAGPDQFITTGNSATLAANAPGSPPTGNGTGTWTVVSGSGTFSPNANTPGATVNGLAEGNNVLQWTISTGGCTDSYDQVEILVAPSHVGLMITSNLVNNGTLVQTSDNNPFIMIGVDKSITGTGTFTNAKLKASSIGTGTLKITFNNTMSGNFSSTWVYRNTFEVASGKTFINGAFTIDAGTFASFLASSIIKNSGNFTNNGTMSANASSTVEFNGSANQTVKANGNSFGHVTVNNTASPGVGSGVTLSDAMTLQNTSNLTVTDGVLLTNGFRVTVANPASTAIVLGGSNSTGTVGWIYGTSASACLRKYMNDDNNTYQLPLGIATRGNLATFVNHQMPNAGGWYLDSWFKANPTTPNSGFPTTLVEPDGHKYVSVCPEGVWVLNPSGATNGTYDLKLYFNGFAGISDNSFGVISRPSDLNNGTNWQLIGDVQATTAASGYAYRTACSSFSEKGVGILDGGLPVELLSFTAECMNDEIVLKWATASELNNDFFTIEKSDDGENYYIVQTFQGAGNSNQVIEYLATDEYTDGFDYYRLKQTDYNGDFVFFEPITVNCDQSAQSQIEVISIQVTEDRLSVHFSMPVSDMVNLCLYDALGNQITCEQQFESGIHEFSFNRSELARGIYFLSIHSGGHQVSHKLILH